jgi:hypothetical protein
MTINDRVKRIHYDIRISCEEEHVLMVEIGDVDIDLREPACPEYDVIRAATTLTTCKAVTECRKKFLMYNGKI